MDLTIKFSLLCSPQFQVESIIFLPEKEKIKNAQAIFTHGYTSHKNSLFNWGKRLVQMGIPTILFDLPGHYLGSRNELQSFEQFCDHSYKLFKEAHNLLNKAIQEQQINQDADPFVILGGHSLGAMISLQSLQEKEFSDVSNKASLLVGYGMPISDKHHVFEGTLFEDMLKIREQLVSPHIPPAKVFRWIAQQKENLHIEKQTILLLNGENDIVVPEQSQTIMQDYLEKKGNQVISSRPKNIPHHEPELAAPHLPSLLDPLLK